MLTQFPPGGAPSAINRQLPQSLSVPGLQQQAYGQQDPFGQIQGMPSGNSGLNQAPMGAVPGSTMGTPGPLGMPPPSGLGMPPQSPMGTGMPPPGMGMGQPGMGMGQGQSSMGSGMNFDPNSVQNPQALSQIQGMAQALSKPAPVSGSPTAASLGHPADQAQGAQGIAQQAGGPQMPTSGMGNMVSGRAGPAY